MKMQRDNIKFSNMGFYGRVGIGKNLGGQKPRAQSFNESAVIFTFLRTSFSSFIYICLQWILCICCTF